MSIAGLRQARSASAERIETETLASLASLEAVAGEWQALWARAHARPFQSPAWLLPWWRHVGRGRLACVSVRRRVGDRLVGLAPLYLVEDAARQRQLFPLGIATTDYLDVLAEPGNEDEVLQAIASHLAAQGDDWDVCEVPQLHESALLLRCRWPAPLRRATHECEPNPVLPLACAVPAGMARRVAYAQRRIARAGQVDYISASREDLMPLLDALERLHSRRWAMRDLPGVLGGSGVLVWHRESAAQLHSQGLLRLLGLRLDGAVIAVLYCLADAPHLERRRWYYYIGGFDPQFAAFSPGVLLVAHAIEQARAEGAAHFDFLRGAESYKYRWGALDQPMFGLSVTRSARPA